jgi:hypothetical protein
VPVAAVDAGGDTPPVELLAALPFEPAPPV